MLSPFPSEDGEGEEGNCCPQESWVLGMNFAEYSPLVPRPQIPTCKCFPGGSLGRMVVPVLEGGSWSSLPSCLRLKGPWPPQRVDLIGQQIYLTHQEPSKGRDQPRLSSRSGRGDRTHCQASSSLEATPRGEGRRGQRQQGGSGGHLRHAHRAPCAEPGSWAWDSCRHVGRTLGLILCCRRLGNS